MSGCYASLIQDLGPSDMLPLCRGPVHPRLGAPADGFQFLLGRPREHGGQNVSDHGLRCFGVGVQVAGPGLV